MNDYKRGGMCLCARPCRRAHRFLGGYIPCGRCRRLPCRSQRGDDLTVTVGVAVAPVPAVAGHRVPLVVVPVPDAVALGSRRRRPVPVVVRAVVRAAARRPGPGSAGEPEAEERLVVDLGGDLRHECEVRGVVGDARHLEPRVAAKDLALVAGHLVVGRLRPRGRRRGRWLPCRSRSLSKLHGSHHDTHTADSKDKNQPSARVVHQSKGL